MKHENACSATAQSEALCLRSADTQVLRLPIREMFWFCESRPWAYRQADWALIEADEGPDGGAYRYRCDEIELTVRISRAALDCPAWRIAATFQNIGAKTRRGFTAGLSLPLAPRDKKKITIPHILYNDNPSADPARIVPHLGDVPGDGIVVEEHRLPIPAVNAEWRQDGVHAFITLLSMPQVTDGDEYDYWSLGVVREAEGERILSLSGPLMFNGMKDVVYGGRCTPLSYLKGYRTLAPGEALEKSWYIAWGQTEEGKGFRNLVDLGYAALRPQTVPLHSHAKMIGYKKNVLDSRFYQDDVCAGYKAFGDANAFGNISGRPEFFLYGWTGQSIKLAWCDCMLGLMTDERFRLARGIACADFFVRRGEGGVPGLFRGYYMIRADNFRGDWQDAAAPLSSRMQGENVADLVDLLSLLRRHGVPAPEGWEDAVRRAAAFLMNPAYQTEGGFYPLEWGTDGAVLTQDMCAAGMPCVLALAKAAEYFGDEACLRYAEEKYAVYAHFHMDTFDVPFARATRDARCEDKEAGIYFFEAAAELYRITDRACYREWAEICADWLLTFVYFWETGFEKGTPCAQSDFRTTGWPGVSVQNHHLDVFFPVYQLYAFGRAAGNARLMEMALNISNALTHGVCTREGEWGFTVIGEQGEQYYQTHYFQLPYPQVLNHLHSFRGGMQRWNPSWITAQVLSSALRFYYIDGQA